MTAAVLLLLALIGTIAAIDNLDIYFYEYVCARTRSLFAHRPLCAPEPKTTCSIFARLCGSLRRLQTLILILLQLIALCVGRSALREARSLADSSFNGNARTCVFLGGLSLKYDSRAENYYLYSSTECDDSTQLRAVERTGCIADSQLRMDEPGRTFCVLRKHHSSIMLKLCVRVCDSAG